MTSVNSISSSPILRERLFPYKKPVIVEMFPVLSFTVISESVLESGLASVKEVKYPRSLLGTGVTYFVFLSMKNAYV
ncbi:MAG: hypothetical protein IPN68_06385 [Bacteroidetes bacterium]|nr:hypothetical protein [Bacteroidota bacterium]